MHLPTLIVTSIWTTALCGNPNSVMDGLTGPEQGPYWEGDLRVPDHFKAAYKSSQWPDARAPYHIHRESGFGIFDLELIRIALKGFARYTCVNLVEIEDPKGKDIGNYINITKKDGCWSFMGLQKIGRQDMSLGVGCTNAVGTVQHEMMHNLGFNHEHNRPDRDDFIDIYVDNVKTAGKKNFEKMSWNEVDERLVDTEYDIESVLHYSSTSFSKDSSTLDTIHPKAKLIKAMTNIEEKVGQRRHMSAKDVLDINLHYDCEWKPKKPEPEDDDVGTYSGHTVWKCDFSRGYCGMTQIHRLDLTMPRKHGDDKDWMHVRGPSPSAPISGPSARDSYQGYYLLLYSGGHSLRGERAKIATPSLRASRSRHLCLRLDYHMQSDRELSSKEPLMGSLRIKILQASKSHPYETVFLVKGSQQIGWQTAHVPIELREDNEKRDFRLIIEGTIGVRSNSDIGITWLSVTQGKNNFLKCR